MDAGSHRIRDLLAAAEQQLTPTSESARLDAEVLLAHALGKNRSYLFAWPERAVGPDARAAFARAVQRRARGEPVAYITGEREFWSLRLKVTPDTLIPRPDTERLVELALERIPADEAGLVADLGTGTGAVALAIARERPLAEIIATDRSERALAVARHNAEALGIANVRFRRQDWCQGFAPDSLALIAVNPPYVAEGDLHLTRGDVRHEPRQALASGPQGLDDLQRLLPQCLPCLRPGGWLLTEHGCDQAEAVAALFHGAGYRAVAQHRDLAGQSRVTLGRRRESR